MINAQFVGNGSAGAGRHRRGLSGQAPPAGGCVGRRGVRACRRPAAAGSGAGYEDGMPFGGAGAGVAVCGVAGSATLSSVVTSGGPWGVGTPLTFL